MLLGKLDHEVRAVREQAFFLHFHVVAFLKDPRRKSWEAVILVSWKERFLRLSGNWQPFNV
jgi:hypothetical protein